MGRKSKKQTQAEKFALVWETTLQRIADGEGMVTLCKEMGVHPYTARQWIMADPRRMNAYNEAYTFQADTRADQVDDIANNLIENGKDMSNQEVQALRSAIDALKWSAAVKNGRKYADRKNIDMPTAQTPEQAREEIRQLQKEFGPALAMIESGNKSVH